MKIRYSETAAFRRCRRKWYNAYVLNLTNEASPEQKFSRAPGTNATGTYVHGLLEAHYKGDDPAALLALYDAAIDDESQYAAEWQESLNLAWIMFTGYVDWTADEGVDQGEETVATELTLEYEILPGVFVTGTIDRLVYDKTWDRYIVEDYKTVATLDKGQQFQVDTQLLTYALLARKNGYPTLSAARHTMLRRVKRTARAKPPFYGRAELEFNDDQLAAHERALRATVQDMMDVRGWTGIGNPDDPLFVYPSPTKDCSWDCPFLGICAAHDDGSDIDGLREALYTVRTTKETEVPS